MGDNDIDEFLKKKWAEALNIYNDELINDLLIKSFEAKQDMEPIFNKIGNWFIKEDKNKQSILYTLTYRGKFYFNIGKYEQALADLTKLLDFEPNNAFALKYQGETYFIMERYKESLASLNKLLKISANNIWALKVHEEITRK